MTKPSRRRVIQYQIDRCEQTLTRLDSNDTLAGSLVDLLVDARHWCEVNGHDYDALDRKAADFHACQVVDADKHG
jgi:hypothetical protein